MCIVVGKAATNINMHTYVLQLGKPQLMYAESRTQCADCCGGGCVFVFFLLSSPPISSPHLTGMSLHYTERHHWCMRKKPNALQLGNPQLHLAPCVGCSWETHNCTQHPALGAVGKATTAPNTKHLSQFSVHNLLNLLPRNTHVCLPRCSFVIQKGRMLATPCLGVKICVNRPAVDPHWVCLFCRNPWTAFGKATTAVGKTTTAPSTLCWRSS